MKQYLVLAAFALALAAPARAQKLNAAQVPAAVVAGFKQTFPQVRKVEWEKEGDKYEAGFRQGLVSMSALLSAGGKLLETESELPPSQLPPAVRDRLTRAYPTYKVTEAAKIVTAGTGATTYEAEVTRNGQKMDLLFDADGREVKQ
ncbi:PepSY-like domain-containing protein [Hymenobacter metallilatus]|uniref:Putative beta-lactamase-inhibitor-like PepSY-like domain-containing protein n=1 Tax=Hymenobacter metallilatus TaxID=2493666 RepID=A0A428JEL7_9BACT|nr:PepSY-like domain-containing protein [Hymenobacter metallilatus]RSK31064.1 hypothetical protein EI290_13655 [Hymenobacter metallilatus]